MSRLALAGCDWQAVFHSAISHTHTHCGRQPLVTCGDMLCFGKRDLVNEHVSVDVYMDRRPLSPNEELLASCVPCPADYSMAWLLHSGRAPLAPDSRSTRVECSGQGSGSAEQSASCGDIIPSCAGVGDANQTAHVCYTCTIHSCAEDKLINMSEYALVTDIWLGRLLVALQTGPFGPRKL